MSKINLRNNEKVTDYESLKQIVNDRKRLLIERKKQTFDIDVLNSQLANTVKKMFNNIAI